ncbi:hypothetical protein BH18ACT5_BH18ACT5_00540 [soil metagenome]
MGETSEARSEEQMMKIDATVMEALELLGR